MTDDLAAPGRARPRARVPASPARRSPRRPPSRSCVPVTSTRSGRGRADAPALRLPAGPGSSSGTVVRSAGTRPGVTRQRRESAGEWRFGVQGVVCRADTGPVIGGEFGAVLARAQGGDEEAFARLFRDVQPALLRYLRVIAAEAAEDVAAETWLGVVAGLTGFRGGEEGFPGGRFTIARQRAGEAGRERERRPGAGAVRCWGGGRAGRAAWASPRG